MAEAILIPAYNAEKTVGLVISHVHEVAPRHDIIVVDDGSRDSTPAIAQQAGVEVLRHQSNRGKGAALQTGFDHITALSYSSVITLDADLQHDPKMIPEFIKAQREVCADIVLGDRMTNRSMMPFHRVLSNTITSLLVRARTGIVINDSQCGYRMIMTRVLERVNISAPGFDGETQFIIKAALQGFLFANVSVPTIYNQEPSHMTHLATTLNFIKVLLTDY